MVLLFLLLELEETIRDFCEGLDESIKFKDTVNLDVIEQGYDTIERLVWEPLLNRLVERLRRKGSRIERVDEKGSWTGPGQRIQSSHEKRGEYMECKLDAISSGDYRYTVMRFNLRRWRQNPRERDINIDFATTGNGSKQKGVLAYPA